MVGETLAPEPAAAATEPRLRIYLAGGIALRGSNGVIVGERDFAGRQARRLFARLAVIHEPVAQVDLADDLWGPNWPTAWQVALRALVSKVRALLARVGAPNAIQVVDATYVLRLPLGTWLDLDAAGDAIHRAEIALAEHNLAAASGWALPARAIASRSLLPGEEGDWLDDLRRHLGDVRLRALECLAESWLRNGDPALAARDASEAIGIDPFRESAHRLLIRAHLAAGNEAAAMHAFVTCRRILADELGISPSAATAELVAGLRAGNIGLRRP